MKILKARTVNNTFYSNGTRIELLVDAIPEGSSLTYDTKEFEGYTAYFAEQDGYVNFLLHDPKNDRGFGGAKFELTIRDRGTRVIKGPWSSRPDVMNSLGFTESVDVLMTDRPEVFDKGYTFMSGNVTKSLLDSYGPMEYVEK